KKGAYVGVPPRDRASASALESFWLCLSRAQPARLRHSQVFSGTRLRLRAHAHYHGKRLRGRRRIVSCYRHRREESAAHKGWRDRLREGFFRPLDLSDGERPARSRGIRPGVIQSLHFRTNVSRGELEHVAPPHEFWMIEPEMAFCDLNGNMDLAEEIVKYLIVDLRENCPEELGLFAKFVDKELLSRLDFVVERPFQRVPYTEAIELLKQSGQKFASRAYSG